MRTKWLVQTNVSPDSPTLQQLRWACQAEGRQLLEFVHPPGIQDEPDIPVEHAQGPFVFHARSPALLGALDTRWSSGVFFSPERFRHEAYAAHYGSAYLNHAASVMSWRELLEHGATHDTYLFIKPIDDYKSFTGQALNTRSLAAYFERLSYLDERISHSTQVVVSRAKEVDAEWRMFIVGDEVVSASMYRPVGSADVPKDVLDFAQDMARGWAPAEVYVLDIGRVDGHLHVVECNCFNASRFYCADVRRIISAVSNYQEQRHLARSSSHP